MRLFLSNGFLVAIAIASIFSNSLAAIASNTQSSHELSKLSLSDSMNIFILHQNNSRLPRPKGSR